METWLRSYSAPHGAPTERLICFPHAGGTAHAFRGWPQRMPAGVETVVVQYPGRQDRLSERCLEDIDAMADALVSELADLTDLPMSMFGHSMGSAVAYEVALRLERDLGFLVDTVFVSGRTAPHRRHGEDDHRLGDEDLVAAMRRLGGGDDDVYRNPKLWPLILPPLRSDLRLLDAYRPVTLTSLQAGFVAFGGQADQTCPVADLHAWTAATTGDLEIRTFPGGHHYLVAAEAEVVAAVVSRLATRPPLTATEQDVVDIWAEHLGISGIGVDDDFFSLGGHSLVGMKILDDIDRRHHVEISPVEFYLRPTPAALAARIRQSIGTP
ncbi:alpha/beta fold hydrolase [Nocardia sp. NBC_00508]|uniref:thioesterase II family protein n=1 Tax=Nocardia sp. NBC_00508 TaxID=2975992 RepID=UPI002E8025C9|nr:alpha/beta fold hydrolase [Nocardia sp. NBC_00508]WUD66561.1 alpha/beta fold hydrolase [Nocardia sp. NBC_00508]